MKGQYTEHILLGPMPQMQLSRCRENFFLTQRTSAFHFCIEQSSRCCAMTRQNVLIMLPRPSILTKAFLDPRAAFSTKASWWWKLWHRNRSHYQTGSVLSWQRSNIWIKTKSNGVYAALESALCCRAMMQTQWQEQCGNGRDFYRDLI